MNSRAFFVLLRTTGLSASLLSCLCSCSCCLLMSKQLVTKNAACLGSKMVEECRTGCWTALSSRSKSLRSTSTVELGSSQFLASGVKGARLLRKLKGWQGQAVGKGVCVCWGVGLQGPRTKHGERRFQQAQDVSHLPAPPAALPADTVYRQIDRAMADV